MLKNIKRFFLFLIIGIVVIGAFIIWWKYQHHELPFQVNSSQTAVVKEMRQLQRLETASFTIEKVIDAGTHGNVFQELLYGDKILLIAHGDVVAGIDLSTLSDKDIQISGKSISLKTPAPTIFFTRLDNEQTRVYDRSQGLLSKGDKDLETAARQQAESSIREAACTAGILTEAKTNAQKELTTLLSALGFTDIHVEVPDGTCTVVD